MKISSLFAGAEEENKKDGLNHQGRR